MNIITMDNGAEVLRASLCFDRFGTVPHGVALCNWEGRNEYVVWDIYSPEDSDAWRAERGTYFQYGTYYEQSDAYKEALDNYKARVGRSL